MLGQPLGDENLVIMAIEQLADAIQEHCLRMCRSDRMPFWQPLTTRDVSIRIHSVWSIGLWKVLIIIVWIDLRHGFIQSLA